VEEENQNETEQESNFSKKELFKTVEEIFIRFSASLKTAQIYESNNFAFVSQINPLLALIQDVLKNEGEAVFQFYENTLFLNSTRVKFDFLSYNKFKFLSDTFREKQIGTIGFESGLDIEELKQFVVLLAGSKGKKEKPFEEFKKKVELSGIRHIFLAEAHSFEIAKNAKDDQTKRTAKKVFFKSISNVKGAFSNEGSQKNLDVKTTRRLIRSIVNVISRDEAYMIGLTNIKNYDDYTINHSANVSILTVCFGRRLGLEKKELIELGLSAFFHDIGKTDIPKDIVDKKDKLTDEERDIIQKHTYQGAGKLICLKGSDYLPVKALYVALEHHLWSNLSGYPKPWKKDTINLYSKIVKICDFFDAVTTPRPYRDYVLTRDEALNLMLEKSGEEFDPVLVKVFANMMGVYPVGTLVALDTGEMGIVIETNPDAAFMLRPKVKIIADVFGNKVDGEIADLAEMDSERRVYRRSIIKSLESHKYGIQPSDYFLAQEL